ncbi:MAG TPA: response regulator [Alphaproteobacteria bacterium]
MASVDYPRLNVLVVEDQDMVREIVVAILRALGCEGIRAVADGDAALAMVLDDAPHLILCDINMQPTDGFQFVEQLKSRGFTGDKRIPTIFLTAHSTADMVKRAKQAGVDAYIVKPVKRAVLEERIRQVLHPAG